MYQPVGDTKLISTVILQSRGAYKIQNISCKMFKFKTYHSVGVSEAYILLTEGIL